MDNLKKERSQNLSVNFRTPNKRKAGKKFAQQIPVDLLKHFLPGFSPAVYLALKPDCFSRTRHLTKPQRPNRNPRSRKLIELT